MFVGFTSLLWHDDSPHNVEFLAAIVESSKSSGEIYCCYAEGRGFDSPFRWLRRRSIVAATLLFGQSSLSNTKLTEPGAFTPGPRNSKWSQSDGAWVQRLVSCRQFQERLLGQWLVLCHCHVWQKRQTASAQHCSAIFCAIPALAFLGTVRLFCSGVTTDSPCSFFRCSQWRN